MIMRPKTDPSEGDLNLSASQLKETRGRLIFSARK